MLGYSFLYMIFWYALGFAALWGVIYTAVRAALTAHRKASAQERPFGRPE